MSAEMRSSIVGAVTAVAADQHAEARAHRRVPGAHVVAVSGGEIAMQITRREFLLQTGQACLGYALGAAAFAAGVAALRPDQRLRAGRRLPGAGLRVPGRRQRRQQHDRPDRHDRDTTPTQRCAARPGWPSPRDTLLPITPPAIGSRFGLHPSLAGLQTLWNEQKLSVVVQRRSARAAADARATIRAARRGPISSSRTPTRSRSGSRRSPIACRRPGGAAASPTGSRSTHRASRRSRRSRADSSRAARRPARCPSRRRRRRSTRCSC